MPGMNMMNHPHPDDQEAAMARADLYKMANYSFKLFKMIKDGDQLEGWVQAKVTKAADYIASVYHYMEYEMKFSEYGNKIENADMYTEAVRTEFKKKLNEAKVKLEKLKEKNQKDLDEVFSSDDKVGSEKKTRTGVATKTSTGLVHKNTSYKDGEDEIATNAKSGKGKASHAKGKSAAEKKSQAPKLKQSPKSAKTWGMKDNEKFDNRDKEVKEGMAPSSPDGATAPPPKGKDGQYPVVTSGPHKGKRWSPKTPGPTNPAMKEAVKSKKGDGNLANNAKPYDKVTQGDVVAGRLGKDEKGGKDKKVKETAISGAPQKSGIPATAKTTVPGMRATPQDLKKAGASAALGEGKCNHTAKGKSCPVHGMKECGSMYEGHAKNLKQQAAIAIAKKKAK